MLVRVFGKNIIRMRMSHHHTIYDVPMWHDSTSYKLSNKYCQYDNS